MAIPGDKPVTVHYLLVHAEVAATVPDQLVQLFERAFIQQQIDPLASRQLAFLMLPLHALLAAAQISIGVPAAHFGPRVERHKTLQ